MSSHTDPRTEPVWAESLNLVGVTAALVAISRSSTTHARPCKHCQKTAKNIKATDYFSNKLSTLECSEKSLSLLNDAAMVDVDLPVLTSAVASSCWHIATNGMQWLLCKYAQPSLHIEFMSHASAQNHNMAAAHNQNSPQPKFNISAQSEHLGLWMIAKHECHVQACCKVLMK